MNIISVVIPLYNKAHTIVETLNSVMCQSYKNFEVIIVNDGSTDNGVELIMHTFYDKRIRIIDQENQGVAVARDNGVKEAKSNYIAFLDADDKWHPDYLKIMDKAIQKYPDSAIFSSAGLIQNADGSIAYRVARKYINRIVQINFFENPFLFTHTSGTIINKKYFYETEGSPKGMLCLQDFALFMQLALVGKFTYVGIPISKYVGGVKGQTTSADKEKQFKLLKYVCFLYNFIYTKSNNISNIAFYRYMKYDIRHRIKGFIKNNNCRSLDYFLANLSNEVLDLFPSWEISLYKSNRVISLCWIDFTKLIWRTYGYPIVGESFDIEKLERKYRKW